MKVKNLLLPIKLRSELSKPHGKLIEGTIENTIPLIKRELETLDKILVGVGDVTAEYLVKNNFRPNIIITDGFTKRKKLREWRHYPSYKELQAHCPAAQITIEAWQAIRTSIMAAINENKLIHLKIHGEEDLLVLPLVMELPLGSIIIYGQPNKGAVIIEVNQEIIANITDILSRMEEINA